MLTMKIALTLTEELLGTLPGDKELLKEFIASKRPAGVDDAEADAIPLEDELAKGTTVFCRLPDGRPAIWDYTIKGFFKDACAAMKRSGDNAFNSTGMKAFKKEIDGLIFIFPRQIALQLPAGMKMGFCERPLRAQTAQGERVSLARSETVPPGTVIEFEVQALKDDLADVIIEWLNYGRLRGLGGWRNSGKGRFNYAVK
jgi:hypothetical protein